MGLYRRWRSRKPRGSSDAEFYAGVDSTWANRDDLKESLAQMRAGDFVVRVSKANDMPVAKDRSEETSVEDNNDL